MFVKPDASAASQMVCRSFEPTAVECDPLQRRQSSQEVSSRAAPIDDVFAFGCRSLL